MSTLPLQSSITKVLHSPTTQKATKPANEEPSIFGFVTDAWNDLFGAYTDFKTFEISQEQFQENQKAQRNLELINGGYYSDASGVYPIDNQMISGVDNNLIIYGGLAVGLALVLFLAIK